MLAVSAGARRQLSIGGASLNIQASVGGLSSPQLRRGAGWRVQQISIEERRIHLAAWVLDRAVLKWRLADVHHREPEPRLPSHAVVAHRAVEYPRRDLPEVGASGAEAGWLGEIAVRVLEMECGVRFFQRLGRGAGPAVFPRSAQPLEHEIMRPPGDGINLHRDAIAHLEVPHRRMRIPVRKAAGRILHQQIVGSDASLNRRIAVVGVGAPVEDACRSKSGVEPPRARVEILESPRATALRAERREQTPVAGTGLRDENAVHLLRSITFFRVAVLLAVPEALPASVPPGVGVGRLVVAAVDAD